MNGLNATITTIIPSHPSDKLKYVHVRSYVCNNNNNNNNNNSSSNNNLTPNSR